MEDLKWVSTLPRKIRMAMYAKAMARLANKAFSPAVAWGLSLWVCMQVLCAALPALGYGAAERFPLWQAGGAIIVALLSAGSSMVNKQRRMTIFLSCVLCFSVLGFALARWDWGLAEGRQMIKISREGAERDVALAKIEGLMETRADEHLIMAMRDYVEARDKSVVDFRQRVASMNDVARGIHDRSWGLNARKPGEMESSQTLRAARSGQEEAKEWLRDREIAAASAKSDLSQLEREARSKARLREKRLLALAEDQGEAHVKLIKEINHKLGIDLVVDMATAWLGSMLVIALSCALNSVPAFSRLSWSKRCAVEVGGCLAQPFVALAKGLRFMAWRLPKRVALAGPRWIMSGGQALLSAAKATPATARSLGGRLASWSSAGLAAALIPDPEERSRLEREAMEKEAISAPAASAVAKAKRRL